MEIIILSTNEIDHKEKSKFVQQGHEAVTPTQLTRKPEDVKKILDADQHKLYELIWKRTIASQMSQSKNLGNHISSKWWRYFIKSNRIHSNF